MRCFGFSGGVMSSRRLQRGIEYAHHDFGPYAQVLEICVQVPGEWRELRVI